MFPVLRLQMPSPRHFVELRRFVAPFPCLEGRQLAALPELAKRSESDPQRPTGTHRDPQEGTHRMLSNVPLGSAERFFSWTSTGGESKRKKM